MRVFVADDHAGYRGGIARLIDEHPGLEMVGQAADGDAALRGVVELQPDVALLDVRMPGLSGLCRRLRADGSAPRTRVVLITGAPDRVMAARGGGGRRRAARQGDTSRRNLRGVGRRGRRKSRLVHRIAPHPTAKRATLPADGARGRP